MKRYEFIIAFSGGKSYDEFYDCLIDFENEVDEHRHDVYCHMQVIEWVQKDGKMTMNELFFKRAATFTPEIDELSSVVRDRRTTTKLKKGLTMCDIA